MDKELKWEKLLSNQGWLKGFTSCVYQEAKEIFPDTSSSSRYCTTVNRIVYRRLDRLKIPTAYLEHEAIRGSVSHGFSRVKGRLNWVVDLQYKFSVPEELRGQITDYMVIPYSKKSEVIAGLDRYHIPKIYHDYWLEELFWDQA